MLREDFHARPPPPRTTRRFSVRRANALFDPIAACFVFMILLIIISIPLRFVKSFFKIAPKKRGGIGRQRPPRARAAGASRPQGAKLLKGAASCSAAKAPQNVLHTALFLPRKYGTITSGRLRWLYLESSVYKIRACSAQKSERSKKEWRCCTDACFVHVLPCRKDPPE